MKHLNWFEIYRRTFFQVRDHQGKMIRFTADTAAEFPFLREKTFAVITAFNPMNRPAEEDENRRQNALLEKDLAAAGYLFYSTTGELNGHAEISFTVENIAEEEALKLGRKYHQHAILYNDARGIRFPEC